MPDIRFTLANERTFLAWLRTAIGLIAAGVALSHLLEPSTGTTALSLILLLSGAVAGVVGLSHFRQADAAIRSGEDLPTNHVAVLLMTGAVVLACAAGVAMVLV